MIDQHPYKVGQVLYFECPGHLGDGHFHRYSATVADVTNNRITVESEHKGVAKYRTALARNMQRWYLVEQNLV